MEGLQGVEFRVSGFRFQFRVSGLGFRGLGGWGKLRGSGVGFGI